MACLAQHKISITISEANLRFKTWRSMMPGSPSLFGLSEVAKHTGFPRWARPQRNRLHKGLLFLTIGAGILWTGIQ